MQYFSHDRKGKNNNVYSLVFLVVVVVFTRSLSFLVFHTFRYRQNIHKLRFGCVFFPNSDLENRIARWIAKNCYFSLVAHNIWTRYFDSIHAKRWNFKNLSHFSDPLCRRWGSLKTALHLSFASNWTKPF